MELIIIEMFYLLILLVMISICVVNILVPRYIWEKLASRNELSEPSETFFRKSRIVSVVVLIILITVLVFPELIWFTDM